MNDSLYIKRLKERLHQNPNSRIFLSLAEELRKRDMLDEAIALLIDGIRKNPDFIAARLTLGRWYLSKDMLFEAKKEFQGIIEKAPDNASAKKWLSEINRLLGVEDEMFPLEEPSNDIEEIEEEVSHKDTAIIIERLNKFLEGIRTHFAEAMPRRDAGAVIERLNKFLERIMTRFVESPKTDKSAVISRLNKFSEAIKVRFAS